jgi:hypothetical protein
MMKDVKRLLRLSVFTLLLTVMSNQEVRTGFQLTITTSLDSVFSSRVFICVSNAQDSSNIINSIILVIQVHVDQIG